MKTHRENAAEAVQAAVEASNPPQAAPVEKTAEVIDMPRPLPHVVQLTELERVAAENLNLKMRLLQADYNAARRQLMDSDKAWTDGVGQRLGVDLTKYDLDFATGTCRLREPPKGAN